MELTGLEQTFVEAATTGDVPATTRLGQQVDAAALHREEQLRAPGALLKAALWYAQHIGPVFPTRPAGPGNTKQPITMHGLKDATRNPVTIRQWWTRWPEANIGLVTGFRFDVIDVDGIPGYESLAQLREQGILPPVLGKATTPRGVHYYIPPTGDGNTTALMPGIDYRGRGGYVLAPPSRLVDNVDDKTTAGSYRWAEPINPHTLPEGNQL